MISDFIEVKGVIWEDMVNYKKICTTLMMPKCNWKCEKECKEAFCQNSGLAAAPSEPLHINGFIRRYMDNLLTEALVLQGLEPLDSLVDVYTVAAAFHDFNIQDDFIIYTGYNKSEIPDSTIQRIASSIPGHLIIKWGRYIPNQTPHYDPILGVNLASDNQYGEIIK